MKTTSNIKDFIKENKAIVRGSILENFKISNNKTIVLLNVYAYKNENDKLPYYEFWGEYDKENKENMKKYIVDLLTMLTIFKLNMTIKKEENIIILDK